MIKELVTDINELSHRCIEFSVLDNNQEKSIELVQDLCDTLETLPDRLYLTANQIGHNERAFAIKFPEEIEVFMNPVLCDYDGMMIMREKDLLTGEEYFIPRFSKVNIQFQDCLGTNRAFKLNEGASIIACQAMDAINGILVSDYGLPILPGFDEATDEEKQEILADYANQLMNLYSSLDKDLDETPETSKVWNGIKFIESVATGETTLEQPELSNRKKKRLSKLLKALKKVGRK